jgi:hypothetical protein
MATLTAEQLADLQADLGIDDSESVFTDEELQRLFDRAGDDYNLSVYYGWRQLLSASAKWVDYKVAQTSVSRSQAFDHIKDMVAFWAAESRNNANQVRIMGMVPVPTKHKDKPHDQRRPYDRRDVRLYADDW